MNTSGLLLPGSSGPISVACLTRHFRIGYFSLSYKEALLEFILCYCSLWFFSCQYPYILCQIPVFVRWFIHVPFLMFHFIYTILSYPLRQVCTLVRCHVCPSGGEAQTRGVDGIEWASARVCAQYNFGTKKLLLQTQSWARCLLRGFYCVACGCMSCAQLRAMQMFAENWRGNPTDRVTERHTYRHKN